MVETIKVSFGIVLIVTTIAANTYSVQCKALDMHYVIFYVPMR